jgi:hypothetical protein
VAHDGHADVDEPRDERKDVFASLDLDGLHPSFPHEAERVRDAELEARLVAAERHVCEQEGRLCAARDGAAVVQHLVHPNLGRAAVPARHHGERVANETDVDPGFFGESAGGKSSSNASARSMV